MVEINSFQINSALTSFLYKSRQTSGNVGSSKDHRNNRPKSAAGVLQRIG